MRDKEKGRLGWNRETALQNTHTQHRSDSMQANQGRRRPAFGRALAEAQREGYSVPWLCLALDWNTGGGFPRVVIPADMVLLELDLSLVRGLDCLVAHRNNLVRALDVAEIALKNGARLCPVMDAETGLFMATDEIRAARGLGVANAL
jgi:hypothetical protein